MREKGFESLSTLSHMNSKSKQILKEILNKIFGKIFEAIADPSTKLINGLCVDYVDLPQKIKEILLPLTSELKDLNETLDSKEFIDACMQLYKLLSLDHRNYLIEWYFINFKKKPNNTNENTNFTFKVIIQ